MPPTPKILPAFALVGLVSLGLTACGTTPPPPAADAAPAANALDTEEGKTFYALGLAMGQNLGAFNLTAAELEVVKSGLTDAALKQTAKVSLQEYGPKIQGLAQARMAAGAAKEGEEAAKFLAEQAAQPGAVVKPSGLVYTEITPGTGAAPAATDTVSVHYRGTLRDGTVFDSSIDRGQPATFPLNQVIACWTEGLQLMKVRGKSRLVCPAAIAYGEQGRPSIPPGAALMFEVELLGIGAGQ